MLNEDEAFKTFESVKNEDNIQEGNQMKRQKNIKDKNKTAENNIM